MKQIKLTIQTDPVAKGRPRFTVSNGVGRTYTPEKTIIAEEELRLRFKAHEDKSFPRYMAIRLAITFFIQKGKWTDRNKNFKGKLTMPSIRPDLDNFLKLVLDAANGVLFYDDCQVTTMRIAKRWSENEHGYVTIKLEEDKDGH